MDCGLLLRIYSDYRDGLADAATKREVQLHLQTCRRCAQYHAALAQGVFLLRSAQPIEPSERFRRTLRGRLADPGRVPAGVGATGRVAAALLIAIAATLLVLEGITRSSESRFAARQLPRPVVVVNPGVPFVRFTPAATTTPALVEHPDVLNRPASFAP